MITSLIACYNEHTFLFQISVLRRCYLFQPGFYFVNNFPHEPFRFFATNFLYIIFSIYFSIHNILCGDNQIAYYS